MKLLIPIILAIACAALWGYNIGTITPRIAKDATTIASNYYESGCDDIIKDSNGVIVCEVTLQSTHDEVKVFKRTGAQ